MDDKRRSGNRSGWAAALLAVPLLVVGYVLSSGPACWLALSGYVPTQTMYVYLPLSLASEHSVWFDSAWDRWLSWWIPASAWVQPVMNDSDLPDP